MWIWLNWFGVLEGNWNVHENEKPFRCEICQSCYKQKSDLNKHIRTVHENEKPFKCEICHSCFGRKSNLNRHKKNVHENEKPFKCENVKVVLGKIVFLSA